MSQSFLVPHIKHPFPSRREIAAMPDDEIIKAIKVANGRAKHLQSEASAFQRHENRCCQELKRRNKARVSQLEESNE